MGNPNVRMYYELLLDWTAADFPMELKIKILQIGMANLRVTLRWPKSALQRGVPSFECPHGP